MKSLACVALVGRPNVGKSSLFNRIVGRRVSIVEPTPGVTRDPLEATAEWAGHTFTLLDTGGLVAPAGDPFAPLIARAAAARLAEADVAVMVVDGQVGLLPADDEIARLLRRWGGRVVLAVNKCESYRAVPYEFYALGLGEPMACSAIHGDGMGDLLDAVVDAIAAARGAPAAPPPAAEEPGVAEELTEEVADTPFAIPSGPVRVALVGRPNAGKSSLVNRLIGREHLIVSDLPGTTRDAVDVPWQHGEHRFVLVDTPGMRRPARVTAELEKSSVGRALRAIARADVAVLVLDAEAGVTEQDQRIAGYAFERGRAAVIVLNKWDLMWADAEAAKRREAEVRGALPFLAYAPVLLTSARTGRGVDRIPALVAEVAAAHRQRLGTPEVNRVLREATSLHAPPSHEGKAMRLYYATQVATAPPTLLCFVNDAVGVRPDYAHYLENRLRAAFPLAGTPLRLHFRTRRREVRGIRRAPGGPRLRA